MEIFFSKEVQAGLDAARRDSLRKASRLRIDVNGVIYPVLRMWKTGFAVEAEDAPKLRGLVDLYDGANHLFQCLIIASEEEAGEMRYEFKRATAVASAAALDFEKAADAPVGLISDGRAG
ncbi:hypothetical protein JQT66_07510 [Sulfitobacter mediterraneus]|uniref:hypothetical protein n=1 Tax=Sulfitobacter mediterraneus TaxID=83219 RepID=UPI00193482C3|nr:hypothetical protein [Sulfitobacter mediterraneus]MBM1310008.1 hypothetical protein [Sulfitobacter mediterraneus]MBM1313892.1 hypothetical protein [Sulfitobacter mediterraneus]MBM1322252.1 hypothetical protein [Sulfitobacter mediterraneus]MBM1326164.1 hypothetical protein [Sulfitobacter mediterraneus]MBM1397510.1 hypothetical protein [Sulfitobacter mediterraneus]